MFTNQVSSAPTRSARPSVNLACVAFELPRAMGVRVYRRCQAALLRASEKVTPLTPELAELCARYEEGALHPDMSKDWTYDRAWVVASARGRTFFQRSELLG
jgi:hypothetical protein